MWLLAGFISSSVATETSTDRPHHLLKAVLTEWLLSVAMVEISKLAAQRLKEHSQANK
jgi:hypothetical protein